MVSVAQETNFLISFISNRNIGQDDFVKRIKSREIDLLKALEASKRERLVYPFCQGLLNEARFDGLSLGSRERIKETYYAYLSQSVSFSQKVKEALDEIDALGIKVLLFKGPAVDCLIYPPDTLRPRSDLDFLVKENPPFIPLYKRGKEGDLKKGERGGFEPPPLKKGERGGFKKRDFQEKIALLEGRLLNLGYAAEKMQGYPIFEFSQSRVFSKHIPDAIPLHIHKHILNNLFFAAGKPPQFNAQMFWQETTPFMNYRSIFCLQPEAQILFLIEHSLKHDFSPLTQLYEIDSLLRHYMAKSFKWEKFVSLSREFALMRPAYVGLLALEKIFFTPIPDQIFSALGIGSLSKGEELFLRRVLGNKHRKYSSYTVYLAMQKGVLNKLRYIGRTLFPAQFSLRAYLVRISRGIAFIPKFAIETILRR